MFLFSFSVIAALATYHTLAFEKSAVWLACPFTCTTMSNWLQKDVVVRSMVPNLHKASSVCCNSVSWEATSSAAAVAARRLASAAYDLQASARAPACNVT